MKCSLLALTRHLDHELDANGSTEVEAHLVGCNRCTNALSQLREDKVALGELNPVHVDRQSVDTLLVHIGVDLASESEIGFEPLDEVAPVAVMEAVPTMPDETDTAITPDLTEEPESHATGIPSWSGAGLANSEPEAEFKSAPQPLTPKTDLPFLAGRGPARAPELSPWQRFTDWAAVLVKGGRGEHGAIESVEIVKGNRAPTYVRETEPGLDDGIDFPGIVEPAFAAAPQPKPIAKSEDVLKPVEKVVEPVVWPAQRDEPLAPRVYPEIEALREELRDKTPQETTVVKEPGELSQKNRRLAIFAGVVLILLLIGVATGKWISNKPVAATATASQTVAHTATARASLTATPTAATPTPVVQGFVASQTVGNGGKGYQIQDLRYGAHTGDVCGQPSSTNCLRIVFDLAAAGSASGDPTAVVGYVNGSTLQVRVLSTIPSGSAGDPGTDVVSSATLVTPPPVSGAAVYNFTLKQSVTVNAYYLSSPVRLVLDLTY